MEVDWNGVGDGQWCRLELDSAYNLKVVITEFTGDLDVDMRRKIKIQVQNYWPEQLEDHSTAFDNT